MLGILRPWYPKSPNAVMTWIGMSRIVYMIINIYNENADMELKSSKNDGRPNSNDRSEFMIVSNRCL